MRIIALVVTLTLPALAQAEPGPGCDPRQGWPCPPDMQGLTAAPGIYPPMPHLPSAPRRMPLSSLIRGLEAAGFDPILEIEREDTAWEIEAEYQGRVVEMRIDPWTGRMLEYEEEDSDEDGAK